MKRDGVTLLEMLLVVAVLAIVAGLAIPIWNGMLASEKVVRGADILRAELGATRVKSIQEGEEYTFCYVPDTGQFWTEPLSASTGSFAPTVGEAPTDKLSVPTANYLPEGVKFKAGAAEESGRSELLEEENGQAAGYERIIFYPDGSAQRAGIILENEYGDTMLVKIRGLTGGTAAVKLDD